MPLRDFKCLECSKKYESIMGSSETTNPPCPACGSAKSERLISKFAIAGRGDLRESSDFHGCHPSDPGPSVASTGGHSCTSHCHHGGNTSTE